MLAELRFPIPVTLEIDAQVEAAERDVAEYAEKRMRAEVALGELVCKQLSDSPSAEMKGTWSLNASAKHVARQAGGNFLLAGCLLDGVAMGLCNLNGTDQLPLNLDRVYELQLRRLFPDTSSTMWQMASTALAVVVAADAGELPSVDHLKFAVLLKFPQSRAHIDSALELLAPFLAMKDYSLALYHKYLGDWLSTSRSSRYRCDLATGHRLLAASLLANICMERKNVGPDNAASSVLGKWLGLEASLLPALELVIAWGMSTCDLPAAAVVESGSIHAERSRHSAGASEFVYATGASQAWLERGYSFSELGAQGSRSLLVQRLGEAIDKGMSCMLEALIVRHGIPGDLLNCCGWDAAPMWQSALRSQPQFLRLLLQLKANPEARDAEGFTAAQRCASRLQVAELKALAAEVKLDLATVTEDGNLFHLIVLHATDWNNNALLEMGNFLLEMKVDPRARDSCGRTPLLCLPFNRTFFEYRTNKYRQRDDEDAYFRLLEGTISVGDPVKEVEEDLAAGALDMFRRLKQDVNDVDSAGNSLLHLTALQSNFTATYDIGWLLTAKAAPQLRNKAGKTAPDLLKEGSFVFSRDEFDHFLCVLAAAGLGLPRHLVSDLAQRFPNAGQPEPNHGTKNPAPSEERDDSLHRLHTSRPKEPEVNQHADDATLMRGSPASAFGIPSSAQQVRTSHPLSKHIALQPENKRSTAEHSVIPASDELAASPWRWQSLVVLLVAVLLGLALWMIRGR